MASPVALVLIIGVFISNSNAEFQINFGQKGATLKDYGLDNHCGVHPEIYSDPDAVAGDDGDWNFQPVSSTDELLHGGHMEGQVLVSAYNKKSCLRTIDFHDVKDEFTLFHIKYRFDSPFPSQAYGELFTVFLLTPEYEEQQQWNQAQTLNTHSAHVAQGWQTTTLGTYEEYYSVPKGSYRVLIITHSKHPVLHVRFFGLSNRFQFDNYTSTSPTTEPTPTPTHPVKETTPNHDTTTATPGSIVGKLFDGMVMNKIDLDMDFIPKKTCNECDN